MAIKTTTAAHIKINTIPYGELEAVFAKIKVHILKYKASVRVVQDTHSHFEVWTTREISIHGKKLRKGVMFASLVKLKNSVGLYLQPMYFDQDLGGGDVAGVLSLRKGLTGFHFMGLDDDLELQVTLLLERGWASYRTKGWV